MLQRDVTVDVPGGDPRVTIITVNAAKSSRHITTYHDLAVGLAFFLVPKSLDMIVLHSPGGVFLQKQLLSASHSEVLPSMSVLRHMHSGASVVEVELVSAAWGSMQTRWHILPTWQFGAAQ
jgi:hypothetical protein